MTRCALIVPMGPLDAPGLDFFQGMTGAERAHWGRIPAEGVAYVCSSRYPDILQWIRSLPDDDRLPPADRQMLVDTLTEVLRQGASGLAEDRMMAVRPWGFQVTDIRCLTHVLVGEDDRALRPHGEWLADHIPGADLVVAPGDHFGPRDAEEERLLPGSPSPPERAFCAAAAKLRRTGHRRSWGVGRRPSDEILDKINRKRQCGVPTTRH